MSTETTSSHKGFLRLLSHESSLVFKMKSRGITGPFTSRPAAPPVISLACAVAFLLFSNETTSICDIISLSDGTVLVVDKAWEEGYEVKYQTSQGIKTVPRNTVKGIQHQEPKVSPGSSARRYGIAQETDQVTTSGAKRNHVAIPFSVPSNEVSEAIVLRLTENVRADPGDLRSKNQLIEALNSYASLQLLKGNSQVAKNSLQQALTYDRKNLMTLLNLAALLYQTAEYRGAEELLLGGLQNDSRNQYGHYLLGEVYYAQDKLREAIAAWKAALELGENPTISQRLKKAEEEAATHDELGFLQSAHFILRYDRKVSDYRLGQEVLDSLERTYRRLSSELPSCAPATVTVVLYADQAYFDITRAPRWSGALFDGKVRVPVKGLTSVTSQLNNILAHELTHSFVNSVVGQKCPTWFNEGFAQIQEGRSSEEHRKFLSQLEANDQLIPLTRLSTSYLKLASESVEMAYLEGLSATEFLIARNGRNVVGALLGLLHQNYSFQDALRSVTNQTLAEFDKSWRVSLAGRSSDFGP